jgi:hypothetical protein
MTRRTRRPAGVLLPFPPPSRPALICGCTWHSHPCHHARRFLHLIASSVTVRAAYAFGDWPPAVRP